MFLILGFDMYASTTTLFETLFVTAGVLWLRLVLLFRLATLLPSSYLPRQFFFTPKRFWVLLRSRDWLKYPLFPFFSLCYTCIYSFLFLVFLSFCLVCFSLSFLSLCSYLHSFFFSNFSHCFRRCSRARAPLCYIRRADTFKRVAETRPRLANVVGKGRFSLIDFLPEV